MYKMKHPIALFVVLAIVALPFQAKTQDAPANGGAQPHVVTYCELSKDPATYNHELVRLTAFVTHGFEDFLVADPTCSSEGFSLWVMYGGNAQSNTIYCCPGEGGDQRRQGPLSIEGIQIPLAEDLTFKGFSDLLKEEGDTTVRLTAVGRFFSGEKQTANGRTWWGGGGHMGCCSLFVIQRVESFDPHARRDLDYTAEAGYYEKEGCKVGALQDRRYISIPYPGEDLTQAITEQRKADAGEAPWLFDDPQKVALDSLKSYYPDEIPNLRPVKKTPARYVFRWRKGKRQVVTVVTRPYWLSFYARSHSVVWVVTTIKEASCD